VEFVAATSRADFDGEPARRFFGGRCFGFWQDETRAFGTVMWGRPLEADIKAMIPFFEIGTDTRFAGHASFVDCRAIESVDMLAFGTLLSYLARGRDAWGPNIGRQAILHPDGVVGVIVAGALHVTRPPYPFACFHGDGTDAFQWCGVPELHRPIASLRESMIELPEMIQRVRTTLKHHGPISIHEVARALGISQRTLQRRLGDAGTSFREERTRHIDLETERLLEGTDLDLEAIARHVGLNCASNLIAHFRATHATTPGAWRSERRGTQMSRGAFDSLPRDRIKTDRS
jgi:AraC-like DNA-binding protein